MSNGWQYLEHAVACRKMADQVRDGQHREQLDRHGARVGSARLRARKRARESEEAGSGANRAGGATLAKRRISPRSTAPIPC